MRFYHGQRLPTEEGELIFRGDIRQCEQSAKGWTGILPDGRKVEVPGPLPPFRTLVGIKTGEPHTTGAYEVYRKPKPTQRKAPPSSERDAEIYAKRKAGRTLKSLGEEYGLSQERVRGIAFREERRQERRSRGYDLSTRARSSIKFVLYHFGINRMDGFMSEELTGDAKIIAKQVAAAGRAAFKGKDASGKKITGKKTLAEIEAWLGKYGLHFASQIELKRNDFRRID